MIVNGKPVHILLRGDTMSAAKWIPYFAGICRKLSGWNQTHYQQYADMRGRAKLVGGQFYSIEIEAGDDVLYYTLVAGDLDGTLNRFVVMGWPENPTPVLERAPDDPLRFSDQYGSAYISRYELDLSIGYASFHAAMARCGKRILVFFSSNSATPVLIKYRRLKATETATPTYIYPISNDTWAQASALYNDRILAVRPPVSLQEANNGDNIFAMEYSGAVRATTLTHSGSVLDSQTLQLAPVFQASQGHTATANHSLNEFHICRGVTTDETHPTYWLASRARTDLQDWIMGENEEQILVPVTYRRRWKIKAQRRDRDALGSVQAESAEIDEAAINPAAPEGYPYSLGHYISFFEEIGAYVVLIVGRLYTNVPYDFYGRDDGKDMHSGDKRIHVFDRYVYDAATLSLQSTEVDCGYARMVIRMKGSNRRAYVHAINEATWAWIPDDNPNTVYRTYMKGALWHAEVSETGLQVTKGDKICDTGYYVKGPLGRLDFVEAQTGFCPEFID